MSSRFFTLYRSLTALALLATPFALPTAHAVNYYVANNGDDAHDGAAPDRPWQTLQKASTTPLAPGDKVLFRRGDVWRGQLRPQSGAEAAPILYGAYGKGEKPLLLGSIRLNRQEDWVHESENVWATTPPCVVGAEMLPNPSFQTDAAGWALHCEEGAAAQGGRDTTAFDSAPAAYRLDCQQAGQRSCNIQLYTAAFPIRAGNNYRLTFRMKCSRPFDLPLPVIMQSGPPWERYAKSTTPAEMRCGPEWTAFECYISAFKTANDARLTFFLGHLLPADAVLHIDTLQLAECTGIIPADIGNVILNKEAFCGIKVWNEADLREQGQYWYDEQQRRLKIYSRECPATFYSDIECAIREHIIDQTNIHHVRYENLALKYGAAHGIGGGNTHHITVRGCDFGFIGGGDQSGGDKTVRFGNGVEFWATAHDNVVERCRFWEIYDAALTNQSNGPNTPQYNIVYRFNLIWNSEYSFEYWNRPEASETHDIYFENNTCYNAGMGWGHAQRPDPSGRHLCFYTSPARARGIHIRNNIFCEAAKNAFYAPAWPREAIDALQMNNNCWTQTEGQMIAFKDRAYTMSEFSDYQREYGKEPHSITTDPMFANPSNLDFHLQPDSPCIDAGLSIGQTADFEDVPIPQRNAPDIGAFERK